MIVVYLILAICSLVQAASASDVPHGLLYTALWLLWGLLTAREAITIARNRYDPSRPQD